VKYKGKAMELIRSRKGTYWSRNWFEVSSRRLGEEP